MDRGSARRATSKDVASAAGVSQPTVSRALRGEPGVSTSTRNRIREIAAALNYVPSHAGRSLVTQRTGRVGIVATELRNPYYPALIAPLHDLLKVSGYRTSLFTDSDEDPVDLEPLVNGSLDGVILTTSKVDSTLPRELARRNVPFVQVGREVDNSPADACVFDNAGGAIEVADLLVDLGHRRIGGLFGPASTSTGREREHAFRNRLTARSIELSRDYSFRGPFNHSTGFNGLRKLLELPEPPTAVFCVSDVIALGACNAAHAEGIAVPDELTIVGFDDIAMARWDVFNLTTVHADLQALAANACELLVRQMNGIQAPPQRIIISVQMKLRGTHGPPSTATKAARGTEGS